MGRRAKATERTGVLERWSAKAITEDEKRWVRATLQRIARRGAERRDRQVGSQVQDCAGQQAGNRGAGAQSQEEYDARGTAEGAAAGSNEVEGTVGALERRRRTVAAEMAETGEIDSPD